MRLIIKTITILTLLVSNSCSSKKTPELYIHNESGRCIEIFNETVNYFENDSLSLSSFEILFDKCEIKLSDYDEFKNERVTKLFEDLNNDNYFFKEAELTKPFSISKDHYTGNICTMVYIFAPNWNFLKKFYYKLFYYSEYKYTNLYLIYDLVNNKLKITRITTNNFTSGNEKSYGVH